MQIDDASLWQSFLDGDRQSFEAIYKLYFKSLYEYGMRRLEDEELVKDCLQDLFTKLWTNRKNLKPTTNIKYYLYASLKNSLINAQVKLSKNPAKAGADFESFKLDFENIPEPELNEQKTEQAQKLLKALNELTGRQKEVIYLRYFEDMDYNQIAQLLDISVKGVYKLNYRALDVLKGIMDLSKNDLIVLLLMIKAVLAK